MSKGWGALQPSLRKWQHVAKTHSLQTVGQLCFGPALSNGWGALQPSLRKWQHVAKTHSLQTVGQLCFGPALLDKSRSVRFLQTSTVARQRMGHIAAFLEEVAACRQNSFAANCRPALLWASSFGQVTVLCALQKSQHVQINNPIPLILNTP